MPSNKYNQIVEGEMMAEAIDQAYLNLARTKINGIHYVKEHHERLIRVAGHLNEEHLTYVMLGLLEINLEASVSL
jgi:hypothetical protein